MPAYGTECRGREPSPYAPQPPGNSHRTRHLQETLLVLSHLRDDCLDDFPDAIVLQRLPESLRSLTESVFVKVEHRDGEWSELALACGCERDVDDRARSSRLTSRSARRGARSGWASARASSRNAPRGFRHSSPRLHPRRRDAWCHCRVVWSFLARALKSLGPLASRATPATTTRFVRSRELRPHVSSGAIAPHR